MKEKQLRELSTNCLDAHHWIDIPAVQNLRPLFTPPFFHTYDYHLCTSNQRVTAYVTTCSGCRDVVDCGTISQSTDE
jgi:hypothetical protein